MDTYLRFFISIILLMYELKTSNAYCPRLVDKTKK